MLIEVKDKVWSNIESCSEKHFQKKALGWGAPDSIAFLSQFQKKYPKTQFVVSGVKSFDSNSKVENENVNLVYLEKVYACLSDIVKSNTFV